MSPLLGSGNPSRVLASIYAVIAPSFRVDGDRHSSAAPADGSRAEVLPAPFDAFHSFINPTP
jgi:hypothetical protein